MTTSYLIYHPTRQQTDIGNFTVYHDNFGGNEDPYLWNRQFLHTYCHITQLSNTPGQINFWVSGDTYPEFSQLFCDCVFVVDQKLFWTNANEIEKHDPIVDNDQTFEHHYKWANPPYNHHQLKRRRRFTLKADPNQSFQPQNKDRQLINILPFLNANGIATQELIRAMTSKRGSRPFKLDNNFGQLLYKHLMNISAIKLKGHQLSNEHPNRKNEKISACK